MENCILCLEEASRPAHQFIEIFSEEGLKLHINKIISKYFWLRPDRSQHNARNICNVCWNTVHDFNEFYLRVSAAHNRLETKHLFEQFTVEDDPLPHVDVDFGKNLDVSSASLLADALCDNFLDTGEIKVEVNDLDLLPQIEVLEDPPNTSDRTARAIRRSRQLKDATPTHVESKRIKWEQTARDNKDADSEQDLPLADYLSIDYKTDFNTEEKSTPSTVTDTQKKRRGRPRKVKENDVVEPPPVEKKKEPTVKVEQIDSDMDDGREFLSAGESDDSDSSSSPDDNDDDSDFSLPDAQPEERYAEIPKRVVVKPKKYRKREKPAVPPVRMSREEIERRKAQQDEYDNIIAKFFNKFPCSKCNLLVQNFGEMKRHFRISHNIDPGYMTCCGRKFHLRKNLADHVLVHWNPDHFKCSTCERIFQDSRALEVHEHTHTNPPEPKEKKIYQCDKCPKTFTTKAAFEYHSFSKHVPKSEFKFTCPECNKKLPTQRKLKDHMKYMHDPESAIICDKCGKQMRTQSNLKKHHQLEHSDVPRPVPTPMQCEICGTWLRHISGLKQHMKTIHEDTGGEHRCHICNKTSTNARALKRHIYHNHECERKFKCTMCEKAFKRPQDLREHTSTHTGEVLYTCPNCPMTFFSNANMYKHRQRLHRAEWEADRKKPRPPNIMQQAVGATAAMKMKQSVGAASAFFASKVTATGQSLDAMIMH